MSSEIAWLDVPGYEGLYKVSSLGEIKSTPRQGSSGGIRPSHKDKKGYYRITLTKNGKGKNYQVHTLVASAFLGDRKDGMEVCHKDGNPENNSLENLYYGTKSDNRKDSVRHGTHNFLKKNYVGKIERGEDCSWSKLNEDTVRYIRSMQGIKSTRQLAKELSVTQGSVAAVQTGRTWRHVT